MQPYACDLSPYSFPKKFIYLIGSIATAEIVTYPLDRIKTLLFAKRYNLTKSFLGYREFHLTYIEIVSIEKFFGLFFGLKAGFDRTFSLLLPKFLIFYQLLNHRSPSNLSFFDLFGLSLVSHTVGGVLVQLSNVLKIKLQTDPISSNLKKVDMISIKYRAISEIYSKEPLFLFRCGLMSSLLSINLTGLIEIWGFLGIKSEMNYFNSLSERTKTVASVFIASVVAAAITNPIDVLHHRIVFEELQGKNSDNLWKLFEKMKNKSGWAVFYNGFLPNLMRNSLFNSILVWILMTAIKFEEKKAYLKGLKHQGRYSIDS